MLRIFVVMTLAILLVGCSESGQRDQEIGSAIDAGRVTNWRTPPLHKLEQALLLCEQPPLAKRHASRCAKREDELAVFVEAMIHCHGLMLPMCDRARAIIASGPPGFARRIESYTAYGHAEEFEWYRSPYNPLLESLFSLDDRLVLLKAGIRRHAIVLVMATFLMGAACWLSDRYRRRLEQDELKLIARKAELASIRLSEKQVQAEAAKSRERARRLEAQAVERRLELERYREQCQREQRETERRRHLSSEREQILRIFGTVD